MKTILAAFTIAMQTLRDKANAALSGMPPLDQIENAREVSFAINTLKFAKDEVERMLGQVEEIEKKLQPEVAAAAQKLVDDQIAAGELVRKADVDTAVAAAKKTAKDEAEAAFNLRQEEIKTIADRRKEIETAHGAEVAAAISDDSLKGDGFDAVKSELGRRVAALSTLGVTAKDKPKPFAEIACGIAFDDAGKTAFDARLESIKELVGPAGASGAAASSAAPKQTPGTGQPPAATAAAAQGGKPEDAPEEGKVIYGF